jgi:hypothetical protein
MNPTNISTQTAVLSRGLRRYAVWSIYRPAGSVDCEDSSNPEKFAQPPEFLDLAALSRAN